MSLDQTKENIDRLLEDDRLKFVLRLRYKNVIAGGLEVVYGHFHQLEQDETVQVTEEDIKKVRVVLDNLKHMLFNYVITEQMSELVDNVILVIHNWNGNVAKHQGIDTDCKFLSHAMKNHFTMIDIFSCVKRVNEHLQQKVATSSLPTDLSRHFMAALDDMYAKDSCE